MFKDLKDSLSKEVQELKEVQVSSAAQAQNQINNLQTDVTKMVDTKLEGMQSQIDSFAAKVMAMDGDECRCTFYSLGWIKRLLWFWVVTSWPSPLCGGESWGTWFPHQESQDEP